MARLPKIAVGIPYGNNATPVKFEQSLRENVLFGVGELFLAQRFEMIGYITDDARNDICRLALENNFDYVFFADMDMVFPKGCIAKMLHSTLKVPDDELPVIAGVYNSRKNYVIHAYKWMDDSEDFRSITHEQDGFRLNNGLMKVDAAGTGCMLIDCNVFENMEWPWFYYEYNVNKASGKRERWSEDMVFCKRLYDAGVHVYLNTDVVCGHMHHFQVIQTTDTEYTIKEV